MKKRVLSIVLALTMIFSLAAVTGMTASAETYGDFEYEVLNNGTVEITGYNGNSKSLDIPSTIGEKTVTIIGLSAFENCKTLTSVKIPDSITEIGGYAFENCTSLSSVSIGKNVKYILPYAFENTAYYNDINNWEDGILYIGDYAISGHLVKWYDEQNPFKVITEAQGDVAIKNGTRLIADFAFGGGDKITSVTMPNSVSIIGTLAFYGCTSLKNVSFGNGVKLIDGEAFGKCTSLSKITIPGSVTEIASYAFVDCPLIKEVTLPASVKIIGTGAFGYVSSPKEDTVIEDYAPLKGFHINCYEYSEAEYYATQNGFDYTTLYAEYGDVNFDSKVNMLDVLLIRKYIAKQPIALDNNLADVTCDDKVNMLDVLLIRKYIAKQPVTLGPKG